MLSVKQEGIKYYFLRLCYDSTWDWTPVSRAFVYKSLVRLLVSTPIKSNLSRLTERKQQEALVFIFEL